MQHVWVVMVELSEDVEKINGLDTVGFRTGKSIVADG